MPLDGAEHFDRLVGNGASRSHQPEATLGSLRLNLDLAFLVVDEAAPSLAASLYVQNFVQLRHHSAVELLLQLRVALNAAFPVTDALDIEDRYF